MSRGGNANTSRVARSKGVPFSKNPVLAVRLPVWRSRVVLFVLFFRMRSRQTAAQSQEGYKSSHEPHIESGEVGVDL